MDQHALCVKEIVVEELEFDDIERHPFGQKKMVLMVWYQWKVKFFSYEEHELVKIKDLNMKYDTSCETSFHYDFSKNGDIYYLS